MKTVWCLFHVYEVGDEQLISIHEKEEDAKEARDRAQRVSGTRNFYIIDWPLN